MRLGRPLLLVAGFSTLAHAAPEAELRSQIEAAEYAISWQGAAGYQAPNRAHGFRTFFTESGIRLKPRQETEASWEWGLQWIGYGRGTETRPVPEATLAPSKNRIEYRRGPFTEWYENGPRGLKQGFILPAPPDESSDAPVHLDLALTGTLRAVLAGDGQAIDFLGAGDVRVLRYTELLVTDARGAVLPSRMEGITRGIRLVIDVQDAVYPLTVDPLTLGPVWTNESNQASAEYGRVVATAGDVNGDGYSDVLVGAPFYDNGESDEGRVYLYLGSPSGLAATPAWTAEGNQVGAQFGNATSTAGDVNGDGYADVLVGAPAYDNGQTNEGRAFLYLGSPTGLALTPAWTKEIDQASASFGASVAPAGDVNGDGFADVIVGAYLWDNGSTNEGGAFVYLGSSSGLAASPVWITEGNQANAWYGSSVATAGDVNGDGFADVIVGSPQFDNGQTDEGRAYVYLGNAGGVSTTAAWTNESNQTSAQYGFSVSTAGDTNGDGYADVLVGAWQYTTPVVSFAGRVFAYAGGPSGPALAPFATIDGSRPDGYMGYSVAPAGDVDGDGYADLMVAAPFHSYSPTEGGGRVDVYLGNAANQLSGGYGYENPVANSAFGWSVATAGDVNGDGFADVLVGAPWAENGQTNEGIVTLYYGSGNRLGGQATAESEQVGAQEGFSVSSAGDINGDGYGDVVVGAPLYDNGQADEGKVFLFLGSASGLVSVPWGFETNQAGSQLGAAVGNAGDVNGDGYGDVIVGAPLYDDLQPDDGRAYVFLGSAAGLSTTPAWVTHGNLSGGRYGAAVATAGDVNGDGFADVIVGAPKDANGEPLEGRAYAFLGSATGLASLPSWTAESNLVDSYFGNSVATAGDVNRDGYADVIVGAPHLTNGSSQEGRVSLYLGSATGLGAFAAWSVESNENGGHLGTSVASAGDTNGDGYADIVLGTPDALVAHVDVYQGSPAGLVFPPVFTWWATGHEASELGISVAGAGDMNGDGYADIVLGAPSFQRSPDGISHVTGFVVNFFGSPTGMSEHPNEFYNTPQEFDRFGASVAGAGDVNGDGFADIVAGAPKWGNGQVDEGRVLVRYGGGSSTSGPRLRPRQRTSDDTRPIARFGTSDSPTAFQLSAIGRTPFGRGRVRLRWEVKPLGSPLDGTATGTGSALETGLGGVALSKQVTGLTGGTQYHWRLRVLYDPVSFPFGIGSPWLTVPWGGVNEAMLRTAAAPVAAGRSSAFDLFKAGLGVTMAWSGIASCNAADTDHAIYEGTLGSFTSHVPVTCTTAPGHSWNFTPQAGNRYFLLVPINSNREGSLGLGAGGAERPQSVSACKPQLVACP